MHKIPVCCPFKLDKREHSSVMARCICCPKHKTSKKADLTSKIRIVTSSNYKR